MVRFLVEATRYHIGKPTVQLYSADDYQSAFYVNLDTDGPVWYAVCNGGPIFSRRNWVTTARAVEEYLTSDHRPGPKPQEP